MLYLRFLLLSVLLLLLVELVLVLEAEAMGGVLALDTAAGLELHTSGF